MFVVKEGRWFWVFSAMGMPWQGPYRTETEALRAAEGELHRPLALNL
jgi:hypothetical protein